MTEKRFARTEMLFGKAGMEKLKNARVAVFGVGGVGGYCVEALARSGIGSLTLIDGDTLSVSNINRQIFATDQTVGRQKTEVARERILSVNPTAQVLTYPIYFLPETADSIDFSTFDYVVDAIDSVKGKTEIILRAQKAGVPVITCLGTGNKTDPTAFCVADIYQTSVCPLARVMRAELKKRGVKKCKAVYSTESPVLPAPCEETPAAGKRSVPASNAFTPAVAGLILAGEVVKDLTGAALPRKGK